MIKPAPEWLTSRLLLAELCNRKGLVGRAVEVGTHRGGFAASFLKNWKGSFLYCVDPYKDWQISNTEYQNDEQERIAAYREAVEETRKAIKPGQSRTFLRLPSPDAAQSFRDNTLDFVYLDADHTYAAILADIRAWWNKIIPGGILAGHDVVCFGEKCCDRNWGVNIQSAICDWLGGFDQQTLPIPDVHIIIEQQDLTPMGGCWSWYAEKAK